VERRRAAAVFRELIEDHHPIDSNRRPTK
jgi:hypothetical protein